jgi:hypothetical protein
VHERVVVDAFARQVNEAECFTLVSFDQLSVVPLALALGVTGDRPNITMKKFKRSSSV